MKEQIYDIQGNRLSIAMKIIAPATSLGITFRNYKTLYVTFTARATNCQALWSLQINIICERW